MENEVNSLDLSEVGGTTPSRTPKGFAPKQKDKEPIQIIGHEIIELLIDQIQYISSIMDYEPSQALHTCIYRTKLGDFCGDDAQKIEAARNSGLRTIKSEVFILSGHSETDLKLRKAARRIAPSSGRAPFFQLGVNIRTCFDSLLSTTEGLAIFGKGGDRISKKFTGDRENDARVILQSMCGRDRDTINGYLNATEYLDLETQKFLFENKATKAFYETTRKQKTLLINNAISQKLTKEKITEEVSSAIRQWFNEYEDKGEITPFSPPTETEVSSVRTNGKVSITSSKLAATVPQNSITSSAKGAVSSLSPTLTLVKKDVQNPKVPDEIIKFGNALINFGNILITKGVNVEVAQNLRLEIANSRLIMNQLEEQIDKVLSTSNLPKNGY